MRSWIIITVFLATACHTPAALYDKPRDESQDPMGGYSSAPPRLDMLFVIDNSLGLNEEQYELIISFTELLKQLDSMEGGRPDLHIGVTSSDLGTGGYRIPSCEDPGGDNGRLLKGENDSCYNPIGQNFIVDIAPVGCHISRAAAGICEAHSCTQHNCREELFTIDGTPFEPAGLMLIEDANGCPRCANYQNEPLRNVFSCIASLGSAGCGFEQFLDAMAFALVGFNEDNHLFLRPDAHLSVTILGDEDDCSASSEALFDPEGGLEDNLGPLTSFRCTEFGVICDEEWDREVLPSNSLYTNCRARTAQDPDTRLFPLTRYEEALDSIAPRDRIHLSTITGPFYGDLSLRRDPTNYPKLGYSCGEAVPSVRILELVRAFSPTKDASAASELSVCSTKYTPLMSALGQKLATRLPLTCIDHTVRGCEEPANRSPMTCTPECTVTETHPEVGVYDVPPCPPCADYPESCDLEWGKYNPDLPVPVCFYVAHNPECLGIASEYSSAKGTELIIARAARPLFSIQGTYHCVAAH